MQKNWLQSYPPGVPADINPDEYASVPAMFAHIVTRFGPKPAYTSFGKTLSYNEVDQLSLQFAAFLQSKLKIEVGTRVALMMPNILAYPVALFGTLRADCTVVNCNPLYTAPELEHQLRDSGAEVIVILENFAHVLAEIRERVPVKHVVVVCMGDLLPVVKGTLLNFVVRYVKRLVPSFVLKDTYTFPEVLEIGRRLKFTAPKIESSHIAFLQYTGGTTGVAKGAMLSHRNMVANAQQARAWVLPYVVEGQEIIITALPLYHIFSLTANCFVYGLLGATNVLIANPRDIRGFVKELKQHRFTAITGVNTLFAALLRNKDFASVDFSSLRISLGGGTAVQRNVAEQWLSVVGKPLVEAYGLTEASPAVCINLIQQREYSGSIGLPLSSTELSLRDDEDQEVAFGKPGEICLRGPQVMRGYWQRPDETALVMSRDGFLRTGDIGIMDERGFVRIVDRKKEMILVSGFNVYPNEVEAAAAMHPGVQEVAAISVPDARTGEAIKIFVVKKDASLTKEALIAYCRENLTGYKVPHQVEFRDDLPKSNVGKILRRQLKEEELKKRSNAS
ncbi:MAG TPA: AMP-binding protein [Rhodocyclaceae bacterium]|nr:AMP-binding protein [Rhodocyclaceae bacterium]